MGNEPPALIRNERMTRHLERARMAVLPAAICLMVVGVMGLLGSAYQFVTFARFDAMWDAQIEAQNTGRTPQQQQMFDDIFSSMRNMKYFYLLHGILAVLTGILAILAGLRTRVLKGYTFGMFAAIINMLPVFGGFCYLGLPLGIVIIIFLNKNESKLGFAIMRGEGELYLKKQRYDESFDVDEFDDEARPRALRPKLEDRDGR